MKLLKRVYRRSLFANRAATAVLLRRQNRRLRHQTKLSNAAPDVRFSVAHDDSLSPMAWLCERQDGLFSFTVGSKVERVNSAIFAGVWASRDWHIDGNSLTFGFGALPHRDSVQFLLPKHPYEFLFVLRNEQTGTDFISPSICFCLARSGRDKDLIESVCANLSKTTDIATAAGAYRYDPLVFKSGKWSLFRFFYGNLRVFPSGMVRIDQTYQGRTFQNFTEYRAHLLQIISDIIANGCHLDRRSPLTPIVAISRGYDSPAVAALAKQVGTNDAATLAVNVNGVDDSGAEIAKTLGLTVHEFNHIVGPEITELDRVDLTEDQTSRACEFIASAGMGDDVAFVNFEPVLTDRIYLSGALGDSVWTLHANMPPHLPCRVPYGKSATEFALRVGFAHVPVPAIGALFPSSIAAISQSDEMRPYSTGGCYDRPIPRRFAEEAGVPRNQFGTSKNATNPKLSLSIEKKKRAFDKIIQRYMV